MSGPRIAILTHSTNPRGGVAHALSLAEALNALGCEAVVHAPDPAGAGFFRAAACATRPVPARPARGDLHALVEARVADYLAYFQDPAQRRFDAFHAQDSISGNALATLKAAGLVDGFVRTVHHLDRFADARLDALQARAVRAADRHCVVSRLWRDVLASEFGVAATLVGNGVDEAVFTLVPDGREAGLRARLGLGAGPVVLAVGGVEARKNSVRLLEAFARLRGDISGAQLVIAGGATLLDHGAMRAAFAQALAASDLPAGAVVETGAVAQADMPALYRLADVLAFPSLNEGYGLAVLEAMASGTPAVVSRIAPFTEYLAADDAAWCAPDDVASITAAMRRALDPVARAHLIVAGHAVARCHAWRSVALAHRILYDEVREHTNA